jgi:hypothetical protein
LEHWFERRLHFESGSGSRVGAVRIGKLRKFQDGEWGCHFSIDFLEPERPVVYGEDALQALHLCVKAVAEHIRAAEDFSGWKIWWLVPQDHGGFDVLRLDPRSWDPAVDLDALVKSSQSIQTPHGEQDENGIDLSPIRALMELPPLERVRLGDRATKDADKLLQLVRHAEGEQN